MKNTFKLKFLFTILTLFTILSKTYSQTIETLGVNSTIICKNGTIDLDFKTTGTFEDGQFKIEFSNPSGNFISSQYIGEYELNDVLIGSDSVVRNISVQLNNNISPGNNYRVRVVFFSEENDHIVIGTTLLQNIRVVNSRLRPTFSLPSVICSGEINLPNNSMNGVMGSWSPGLNHDVVNTTTTNHTFIPNDGYCAKSTTRSITIRSKITPIFNTIESVCYGETISDLPTSSINNISGTWSPLLNNTETTTYTFTPILNSCASTVVQTIVVNPTVIHDTSITAFLTYTWPVNGETYTLSGIYTHISNCIESRLNLNIVQNCNLEILSGITGTSIGICQNGISNPTYTINPVDGATSYEWIAPQGTEIIEGQGTTSITLNILSNFTSGNLSVLALNFCDTSESKVLFIRSVYYTPLTPTGPTIGLCSEGLSTVIYSAAIVSGVTSYNWSVPEGTIIISGQGTNSITVSISENFSIGGLKLTMTNSCGESPIRGIILRSTLTQPGAISGPTTSLCAQVISTSTYSIAAVSGATNYTWTSPNGTSILSGQGTNSIVVQFLDGFTSGNLSVVANNSCGSSIARTLLIRSTLSAPGVITGPTTGLCSQGISTASYSITPIVGATGYTWTAPTGTSISSGQGTNSIELIILDGFTSGSLNVVANNNCGSSTPSSLSIRSTLGQLGAISGLTIGLCSQGTPSVTYSVTAQSNATSYTWSAPNGTTILSGQGTNSVVLGFQDNFTLGNLGVVSNNQCGASLVRIISLFSTTGIPGVITGSSSNLCPNGINNPTYTISPVSGASSYTWTAPTGTTIVSGQGTTSVILNITNSFTSGNLSVVSNNACGSSASRTLALSSSIASPISIIGPINNLCPNGINNPTYTIGSVSGANGYTWTAPAGTIITSGQGTTSITLEITNSFVSGELSVVSNNDCGSSTPRTLVISSTITTPGVITGITNNLCPNGLNNPTYSIEAVAGSSSYTWAAPEGCTIISGQGTTTVTLEITNSFTSGNLSVIANNSCGSSSSRTLALNSTISTPLSISGTTNNLCPNGINVTSYTIADVVGATSYTWIAPAGTTIVSGQGTRSITLEITNIFVSGNLSVVANNNCGSSGARTLALSSSPILPGSISGPINNLCPNGINNPTYTIPAVAGATSYVWTAPAGTTIVSGQGTRTITVSISSSFNSGVITVGALNQCGIGPSRSLSITSVPLTPTSIIGSTTPCGTVTYTCATVAQAISYTWTVPTGMEIVSGQGTNSIIVNINTSSVTGSITVRASNNCKTGNARSLLVNSCNINTRIYETTQPVSEVEVFVYPNPTNDLINVQLSNKFEENLKVEIISFIGKKVSDVEIQKGDIDVNISLDKISTGFYFLQVVKSDNKLIYSTIIFKNN